MTNFQNAQKAAGRDHRPDDKAIASTGARRRRQLTPSN